METVPPRFSLRDLPLPAKLVITVFLLSVGLGYLSAMVQLHFKHAAKGNAFPTLDDVVGRFSGQVPPWKPVEPKTDAAAALPKKELKIITAQIKFIFTERCAVCHSDDGGEKPHLDTWDAIAKYLEPNGKSSEIYKLITADPSAPFDKGSSMRQAFHEKGYINGKEWKKVAKDLPAEELKKLVEERELERLGLVAWLEAGAPKEGYDSNSFTPAADAKVGASDDPNDRVAKAKRRQMSVESLTQSTHAHLLSFSMLWALTGLVFAFTSYPLWLRCGISPVVALAQVADISCWWLARLPQMGPYFAAAIMGTGAIVGMGLGLQIVLSLFNMYKTGGRVIVALLFVVAAAGGVYLAPKVMNEVNAEKAG